MNQYISIWMIFLTIILCTFTIQGNCQQISSNHKVHFSGKIHMDALPADSIRLWVVAEPINHQMGVRMYTANCDKEGRFDLTLDSVNHVQRMSMQFRGKLSLGLSNVYLEPGDDICLDFNSKERAFTISFSGKGAAKYNYAAAIHDVGSFEEFLRIKDLPEFRRDSGVFNLKNIEASLRLSNYNVEKYKKAYNFYKDQLSFAVQQAIEADLKGIQESAIIGAIDFNYFRSNEQQAILSFYRKVLPSRPDTNNARLKSVSDIYIDYLLSRSRLEVNLKNGNRHAEIHELYAQLKNDYSGILLDRTVVTYLMGHPKGNQNEYLAAVEEAVHFVKNTKGVQYLRQQLKASGNHAAVYNFSLPDSTGKVWQLSDFRGKVVLVDFWFTNCGPCIALAKNLHEQVIPPLKSDNRVAFVTVNVDKSKQKWLESIQSGIYTDSASINLFTMGQELNHPFPRYYNLNGCPALLMINREGKLISANPPRDGRELLDAIKREL